jgi:hypothetical protein
VLANGVPLANNFMADAPVKGTTAWTRYTIALPVAPNAEFIEVGAMMQGKGTLWLDDVELEMAASDHVVGVGTARPGCARRRGRDHPHRRVRCPRAHVGRSRGRAGCTVGQIAKSLVFQSASGTPVLVIASGAYRVDEAKIATLAGEAIGKADASFVRTATGYAIGGIPPLAHVTPGAHVHRPESPRVRNCLRGRGHAARDVPHYSRGAGPRSAGHGGRHGTLARIAMDRRAFLLAAPAVLAAGCVSVGGAAGPPAPAPTLRLGDRWVYSCSDGYRVPVTWVETHEVTAVDATGIAVRVMGKGEVNFQRVELLSSPGVVQIARPTIPTRRARSIRR